MNCNNETFFSWLQFPKSSNYRGFYSSGDQQQVFELVKVRIIEVRNIEVFLGEFIREF